MRPNILFYFTDQQRADTCGCYGQSLPITPVLDALAADGVCFENAFTPQPVCGPCRAIFQTGKLASELGCFRNRLMLPGNVKTLGAYMEELGYETAYIGKWHLASQGQIGGPAEVDHSRTAVPLQLRGGYTGFWRVSDVLEFTSHGYDGYVFDENNNRIDFSGYRTDCITDMALTFFDTYSGERPFFMTVSHIEPHHQNDHGHYEGPAGSREKYRVYPVPGDLEALGGNYREEYPDYLGQCASLDENLGRLVNKLKEKGLFDNTVIIFASDHGSHFMTRNRDAHRNGSDDYKRSMHDSCLRVPLVISGGPFRGGVTEKQIVSTAGLPKTILALAGLDVGEEMIGEDLAAVVAGKYPDRRNEAFAQISESRVGRTLRTQRYAYSVYAPGINGCAQADSDLYVDDFLYDLEKDPYELTNLACDPEYEAVRQDLRRRLLYWIEKEEHKKPEIIGCQL